MDAIYQAHEIGPTTHRRNRGVRFITGFVEFRSYSRGVDAQNGGEISEVVVVPAVGHYEASWHKTLLARKSLDFGRCLASSP